MKNLKYLVYISIIFLPLLSCYQEGGLVVSDPLEDLYSQEETIELRGSGAPIECGKRYPFPVFSQIKQLECNTRGDFSVVDVGTDSSPDGVDIFYYVLEITYISGYEVCYSVAKLDPSIRLAAGGAYGIDKYYVTRYEGYESSRGRGVRWVKSNRLLINCQ